MYSTAYLINYTSELLYIFTALFCALIRWLHVCSRYQTYADYFFPARREFIFLCLLPLMEAPYLLHIESFDALFAAFVWSVMAYPSALSLMLNRYFFQGQRLTFKVFLTRFFPLLLIYAPLFVCGMKGGDSLLPYRWPITGAVLVIFAFQSFFILKLLIRIYRVMKHYQAMEYSNENGAQIRMQRMAFYSLPIEMFLWLLLCFLINNEWSLLSWNAVFTVSLLATLVYCLHTMHHGIYDSELDEFIPPKQSRSTEAQCVELAESLRQLIEAGEAYKSPNLRLSEVMKPLHCSYAEATAAIACSPYGTFAHLVNTLRVEHCQDAMLRMDDQRMKIETVGLDYGFTSRTTFYREFKAITGQTPLSWYRQHAAASC
jgi:AraC-like DNA-binding protein